MFGSIVVSGLAIGAIYAMIGIAYNTMYSVSRVMSFTAGAIAMLGGVFGALFIDRLGLPVLVGFFLTLVCCGGLNVLAEIVAVRPVLKSIERHLYVLTTLAVALMATQLVAIEWSTEPQPFPRVIGLGSGLLDEKFWLPIAACAVVSIAMELLYHTTLVGRAFIAIAEDNLAARALGLPERNLRLLSYAIAGMVAGVAGFAGGQLMLAFFANEHLLNFLGFVPVALGGLGNNRGAVASGLFIGLLQQAANFLLGGVFASVLVFGVFITILLMVPAGLFNKSQARRV